MQNQIKQSNSNKTTNDYLLSEANIEYLELKYGLEPVLFTIPQKHGLQKMAYSLHKLNQVSR